MQEDGRSWLVLRGDLRGHVRIGAVAFAAVLGLAVLAAVLGRGEMVGGLLAGGCVVAWMSLELRAGTWASAVGLTVRDEWTTRRVPWEEVEAVDSDHPGRWATSVVARTKGGSTVRLRGVQPDEVGEVRTAWREAVGP